MSILSETLTKCYELVRGFHFTMRHKISLAIETGEAHKAFSPEVIIPSSQDAHSLPTDCCDGNDISVRDLGPKNDEVASRPLCQLTPFTFLAGIPPKL